MKCCKCRKQEAVFRLEESDVVFPLCHVCSYRACEAYRKLGVTPNEKFMPNPKESHGGLAYESKMGKDEGFEHD